MNTQPFDTEPPPLTHPESEAPPAEPEACLFFDRAGMLWVLACVAIAIAAGRWIPRLTEPGIWQAETALAAKTGEQAGQQTEARAPLPVLGTDKPLPATPVSQLKREVF